MDKLLEWNKSEKKKINEIWYGLVLTDWPILLQCCIGRYLLAPPPKPWRSKVGAKKEGKGFAWQICFEILKYGQSFIFGIATILPPLPRAPLPKCWQLFQLGNKIVYKTLKNGQNTFKILIVMLTFGLEPKTCMKQICGHHRKKRCNKYLGYLDFRFVWNIIGTRTLGCRQMSEGQMREQKGGNAPPEKVRRTTIGVLCKNKMKMTYGQNKNQKPPHPHRNPPKMSAKRAHVLLSGRPKKRRDMF